MRLTGVAALTVHAPDAGFRPGEAVRLRATTDGPAVLTVEGLRPGTRVGGVRAGQDGRAVVRLR